ncbi:RHS repeat protein [Niabella pedocola]|uniref:RHS repeat protein n=1 Tax=Niabella pedocola TaxID=1752077 RepID=A0ABS8PW08_9BACT|nr:RHS repeat domain-containing protein [Niabella pedocola]MCD2425095.1 RHS repeat protein [Niabella pedocola]
MKKILTALVLLTSCLCCISQEKLMQIPVAPSVREMEKYTTYNVGLQNGVASFEIPIHNIVTGKITIPIVLSYKAAPIENNGPTDEVGTGWMITPKYSVSRTVYNRTDELYPMPDSMLEKLHAYTNNADRDFFLSSFIRLGYEPEIPNATDYWDSEYDLFHYNTATSNGSFIITDRANRQIRQISKNTTSISYLQDAVTQGGGDPIPAGIKYLEITDGNGIKYEMGKQAGSNEKLYAVTATEDGSAITGWYASRITDPAGNAVKINYTKGYETDRNLRTSVFVKNKTMLPDFSSSGVISHNTSIPYNYFKVMQVKSIETGAEKILYYRQKDNINEGGRIDSILIVNMNNERVKKVQFHYSLSWMHQMLDSVTLTGSNGEMQRYRFEYNNRGNEYPQDHWGFYASAGIGDQRYPAFQNIHFLINGECALITLSNIIALNAVYTSSQAAESYVLKKIHFPTGGSRTYEYEPHQYTGFDERYNAMGTKEMGIRVKQISSYDGANNTLIEEYKYGFNENGLGIVYNDMARTSWFASEGAELLLSPSNYNSVIGRSVLYNSTNPYAGMVNSKGSIYYPQVTVYKKKQSGPGYDYGKTEYFFNNAESVYSEYGYKFYSTIGGLNLTCSVLYEIGSDRIYRPSHIDYSETWKQPFLKEERYYTQRGSSLFLTRKKEYAYIQKDTENYGGLHVRRFVSCYPEYHPSLKDYYYQHVPSLFDYAEYWISCATNLLSQEKETLYDDLGVTPVKTTTTDFDYNGLNQTAVISAMNSKNEQKSTSYKYPIDLPSIPVYQQMIGKNILNPVIEDTRKVNSLQTFYGVTNYGLVNSIYVPVSVKDQYGNNSLETKYSFNAFDVKGNLLEQQKANDVREVFLWGYRSQYPVAKVSGSDYVTVKSFISQAILDSAHLYTEDQVRTELNKIRTGLANTSSQVFTYTYRPSFGMTSETDPTGRTTFYSYDGFGRLSLVKDSEGKIVKKICYNYAGMQTDCSTGMLVTTTPQWTATGSYRCVTDGGGSNTGYQEREERDVNPYSSSYNQLRWTNNGYNTNSCPLPASCSYPCDNYGPTYRCVNGFCENGYMVYTDTYYDNTNHRYVCVYHYEWSDGVWSENYYEYNYDGYCRF